MQEVINEQQAAFKELRERLATAAADPLGTQRTRTEVFDNAAGMVRALFRVFTTISPFGARRTASRQATRRGARCTARPGSDRSERPDRHHSCWS